jgi:hypothetical protein
MKSIYGQEMLKLEYEKGIINEKIFDDEYSEKEDLEAINCMMGF